MRLETEAFLKEQSTCLECEAEELEEKEDEDGLPFDEDKINQLKDLLDQAQEDEDDEGDSSDENS